METASAENIRRHVEEFCTGIGVRLAGSAQERAAAEYAGKVCGSYGAKIAIEDFPVRERCVQKEELSIQIGGKWESFPCSLFGSAPSTDGKTLEGDLVWFDSHTDYLRGDLSMLRGKAVVHLGCHILKPEYYENLMKAEPAFLIFIDTRFTSTLPLADGLFPAFVKAMGAKPTVNAAFADAWTWKTKGAVRARLRVEGGVRESFSENMISEIPGTDPEAGCIYVGGHHDTQAGTVGADDNAVGSAAVMELTRIFSKEKHRRTLKLISFGAEEQLSVGSASYVRAHRAEVERSGVLMVNFDTYGSAMGWTNIQCVGPDAFRDLVDGAFRKQDIYPLISREITPYVDNFAFNAAGLPSVWIYRKNCEEGHFYHHRADALPDKLDFNICAGIVDAGADLIRAFADAEDLSALRRISEESKNEIRGFWNEVYGGW